MQLGSNSVAPLLQNTDVDLNAFNFSISQAGGQYFGIDVTGSYFFIGDDFVLGNGTEMFLQDNISAIAMTTNINGSTGSRVFEISGGVINSFSFGDLSKANNGTSFIIDDANKIVEIISNVLSYRYLYMNIATGVYQIGDIDAGHSTSVFTVNSGTEDFSMTTGGLRVLEANIGTGYYAIGDIDNSNTFFHIQSNFSLIEALIVNSHYLSIDAINSLYNFGDIDAANGGTYFSIDDNTQKVQIVTGVGANAFFLLDFSNGLYEMGDLNSIFNSNYFQINDSTNQFRMGNFLNGGYCFYGDTTNYNVQIGDVNRIANGTVWYVDDTTKLLFAKTGVNKYCLFLDVTNGLYQLGDIAGVSNSTFLSIDDTNKKATFTANAKTWTFDGTNSKITLSNVRYEQAKGTDTAAANDLTLPGTGNFIKITGNTQINAITTLNWQAGSVVTLWFTGTPTVKNNTAGGAGTAKIFLNGSVDLAAANNTMLTLVYDGTEWQEISRKVA